MYSYIAVCYPVTLVTTGHLISPVTVVTIEIRKDVEAYNLHFLHILAFQHVGNNLCKPHEKLYIKFLTWM